VVSTLSNITNIFIKSRVLFANVKDIPRTSDYLVHIENKPILLCVALLLPVIGNIIAAIYHFKNIKVDSQSRNAHIQTTKKKAECISDPKQMEELLEISGLYLENASNQIKNNRELVKKAILSNPSAIKFASEELINGPDFFLELLKELRKEIDDKGISCNIMALNIFQTILIFMNW
jgi:hypothetical protein